MSDERQYVLPFEEMATYLPSPLRLHDCVLPNPAMSSFIGISGFEKRCYSASVALAERGWSCRRTFCVHYMQDAMKPVNDTHIADLETALRRLCLSESPHPVEHNDLVVGSDFGDQLLKAMVASGCDPNDESEEVVFDVSVGSSRLLLEGLHAVFTSRWRVTIVYSEATKYRPEFEEYRQYLSKGRFQNVQAPEFLTMGVESVEILRRIPGLCADSRPTYLVAVPSFSPMRMESVIEELSPSRVHWLFGVPHLVRNRWRIDAQRDYHAGMCEAMHRHCYVSTFDYREMFQVLENIYRRRREQYDVMVCSLGSKLQKVGQVLFHVLRPEVGAVVSIPKKWDPDRFSDETRAVYVLPLGSCVDLRRRFAATKTFRL